MCVSIAEPQFPHPYNEELDLDVLKDPSGSQFLNDTTRCFSSLGLSLCICNQQGVEMGSSQCPLQLHHLVDPHEKPCLPSHVSCLLDTIRPYLALGKCQVTCWSPRTRVCQERTQEMELLFSLGALTATGPGCHSPQNKGKHVGGGSASVVFF